ncbi:MAG: isoleucine--tRNA ligase [Clostridia bacterium]|nr:isoleucine--tRNA ligase [Clostridia bacterium]
MRKKYNDTLNLPKIDFPMKANLSEREPEILSKWQKNNIYKKILAKNSKNKKYILHDGPPFANGEIHLGHALNKILKDFIVKFKSMQGFCAPFIPGWDTHGLPIEVKAKKNFKSYDNLGISELRKVCKDIAENYINIQRSSFKRLGIFGDWENPYVTFEPKFEAKQIEVFANLVKNGAIYRGLKPVYWCCDCKTALAEAEIEYKQDSCDSIFIKFKLKDDLNKFSNLNIDKEKIYFLIWTTTAWTLPGNVAICLNKDFNYSLVKVNDEYLIIASDLVKSCMNEAKISDFKIIKEFSGAELEGMKALHPFIERESLIITGGHVNLESGTGCVHTAPGHGLEDFECCKNYNFEILVPVDENGVMNSLSGGFEGMNTLKASEEIIKLLESKNLLFAKKNIVHKYPHCWRCKNPIIFRATNQWFCSVDSFKKEAINAAKNVNWMPKWGGERIESMIRERSDWCISRQRKWGVPIPIFFCKKCGEPFADYNTIIDVSKIFAEYGSGVWYEKDAEFFLKNNQTCKSCGFKEFIKEKDIMDVWFDSGSSYHAVIPESDFPADLYLEGADQYRGWFQSSLLTAVGIGKSAPYKSVLTHGWVVDEESRKQSKSLGNVIEPASIIQKYGADVLRLWVSSVNYTDNVKISNEILAQISESYRKIRNTARFILGNLYDFDPKKDLVKSEELESLDFFMILKTKKIFEKCIEFYEKFEFYSVFQEVQKFCITELSNFYLDVIKDRLYVEKKDGFLRRSAQTTIWVILVHLTKILAPILSFTCEEIWSFMPGVKDFDSIFMNDLKFEYEIENDKNLNQYWHNVIEVADFIKKHLEVARKQKIIGSAMEADVYLNADATQVDDVGVFLSDLKEICIVSSVNFSEFNPNSEEKVIVKKSSMQKCQRCWTYDKSVGKNSEYGDICERCINILHK